MSRSGLAAGAAVALLFGGLMAASRAALADGLGAGEALQADHAYQCNGERIFVSHCGEAETASCQVVYLDRPAGPNRDRIESRGDLIRKLRACGTTAAPPPAPRQSAAPAAPAAPRQAAAAAQPKAADKGNPPGTFFNAALCPTVSRLVALAHEDFKSVDGGPDRTAKDPDYNHLSKLTLPGANCDVVHEKGQAPSLSCNWPPSKDVDDQFFDLVGAVAKCTGAKPDISLLEEEHIPDVTVVSQGASFNVFIINSFLGFGVERAKPSGPGRGRGPTPASKP